MGLGPKLPGKPCAFSGAWLKNGTTLLKLTEGLLGRHRHQENRISFSERRTEDISTTVDATLLGAVGLPEYDNAPPEQRPERGLLGLRKAMGVYANLRPVRTYKALIHSSPLKDELIEGTDMIIVRELTGGHLLWNAARNFRLWRRRARGQHHGLYAA